MMASSSSLSDTAARRPASTRITASLAVRRGGSFSHRTFRDAISSTVTRVTSCASGNPHTVLMPLCDFCARVLLWSQMRLTSARRGSRPASMFWTALAAASAALSVIPGLPTAPAPVEPLPQCVPTASTFLRSSSSTTTATDTTRSAWTLSSLASSSLSSAAADSLVSERCATPTLPRTPSSSRRRRASSCVRCSSTCSRSFSPLSSDSAISRSRLAIAASVFSIRSRISALASSMLSSSSMRAACSAAVAAAAAARATRSKGGFSSSPPTGSSSPAA
mmetsp:Transcript_14176/g.34350  ORF Transcript_14176/g.34350 Transcript_14176/m.34350 type:complete len:278 (-) Transcript_14176:912-1745(-)